MAEYSFTTKWNFNYPIEKVWNEIYHPENWPKWWDYVERAAEIKKGDSLGEGSIWIYKWKTRLFYSFTFYVETYLVEPPEKLEGNASGDLEGTGKWALSENNGITTVTYEWNVKTNKSWMNVLAPIAYPFFKWNHKAVMDNGYKGLNNRLRSVN